MRLLDAARNGNFISVIAGKEQSGIGLLQFLDLVQIGLMVQPVLGDGASPLVNQGIAGTTRNSQQRLQILPDKLQE